MGTPNSDRAAEVLAVRDAFVKGALFRSVLSGRIDDATATQEAARRYPMPLVWVPRVGESEFRVFDGRLQWRPLGGDWCLSGQPVEVIRDLIANPTEQRRADEVTP